MSNPCDQFVSSLPSGQGFICKTCSYPRTEHSDWVDTCPHPLPQLCVLSRQTAESLNDYVVCKCGMVLPLIQKMHVAIIPAHEVPVLQKDRSYCDDCRNRNGVHDIMCPALRRQVMIT